MTRDDIQLEDIPEWPVVHIDLHPDPNTGTPLLTISGARLTVPAGHDPRRYAIHAASSRAAVLGRPIRAIATDGDHKWPLIIHPDGAITDPNAAPRRTDRARRPHQARMPAALALGLAGLVFLIGLATSVFVIGPTAQRTLAAPSPAPPPPANTTLPSSPPPRSTPLTRTRKQPTPRPRPAPTTKPSTAPPRRGPVAVGNYCLAGFIGVAIAERCAPDTAEQTWTFQNGQLRQPDGCLTVADRRAILATCTDDDTQRWNRTHTGQLHNTGTNTCLTPAGNDRDTATISVVTC